MGGGGGSCFCTHPQRVQHGKEDPVGPAPCPVLGASGQVWRAVQEPVLAESRPIADQLLTARPSQTCLAVQIKGDGASSLHPVGRRKPPRPFPVSAPPSPAACSP